MASRGQSVTVTYIAWNASTNAGQTGDVLNHTLRVVKDGTSAAPTNSPAEVDNVNAPGVYKITLTATECTADCVVVCGKSSTPSVSIMPITIMFEQLPTAAPTSAGGVRDAAFINGVTTSSVTAVNANVGTTQPVNFTGTAGSALVKGDTEDWGGVAVGGMPNSTTPPTVAAIVTAVFTDLMASSDFSTANSFGALVKANLDTNIGSRMATYAQPTGFLAASFPATVASPTNITGGTITTVSGDVQGKLLGGGASAITGTGARAVDGGGNALATAASQTTIINDVVALGSPMQAGSTVVLAAAQPNYAPSKAGDAMNLISSALDAILIESGIVASAALVNDAGTQLTAVNARQALALVLSAVAGALAGGGTTSVTVPPAGKPASSSRIAATVDINGDRSAMTLRVPT